MTKKKPTVKQPGWLNKTEICLGLDISRQAFNKWGVESVCKIGREVFYNLSDVVQNRIEHDQLTNPEYGNPDEQSEFEQLRVDKLREEVNQLKLRNSVLEGKSLPAEGVKVILAKILSSSAEVLDSLPLSIRRKFPDLDKRIIDSISEVTIKHQNEVARLGDHIEEVIEDVQTEAEERIR